MSVENPSEIPPEEEKLETRAEYLSEGKERIEARNLEAQLQAYVSEGKKALMQLEMCLHFVQKNLDSKRRCPIDGQNFNAAKKGLESLAASQDILTPVNACRNLRALGGDWQERSGIYSVEQVASEGKINDLPIKEVLAETGDRVRNSAQQLPGKAAQMELPIESIMKFKTALQQWIDAHHQIYSLCAQIAPVVEQYEILLNHVQAADPAEVTAIPGYKEMEINLEAAVAKLSIINNLLAEAAREMIGEEAA